MEPLLWTRLLALFAARGGLPNGTIVDSGANDGTTGAMLAKHFSAHTVLCVEPVLTNVEIIHKNKPENMRVVHGGLGETYGFDSYPSSLDRQKGSIHVQIGALQIYKKHRRAQERSPFPIYPLSALVRRSRLVFLHLDVEGAEVSALRGAKTVITRDRPFLTAETFPVSNATNHLLLNTTLRSLGYRCELVDESCGWGDCRNLICEPTFESFQTKISNF